MVSNIGFTLFLVLLEGTFAGIIHCWHTLLVSFWVSTSQRSVRESLLRPFIESRMCLFEGMLLVGFERDVMHFVFFLFFLPKNGKIMHVLSNKSVCLSIWVLWILEKKLFSLYFTFCFDKIIIGCSSRVLIGRDACLSKILVNSKVMSSMTSGQDISFQTSTNK